MEIRSDVSATYGAAGSLAAASREAGRSFQSLSGVADASAAHSHDTAVIAFSTCSVALARAMVRDAVAVRRMADSFREQDDALARNLGAMS